MLGCPPKSCQTTLNHVKNLRSSGFSPTLFTPPRISIQLLAFTSSPKIMGSAFVNSALTSGITGFISALVIAINAWAVYEAVATQVMLETRGIFGTRAGLRELFKTIGDCYRLGEC